MTKWRSLFWFTAWCTGAVCTMFAGGDAISILAEIKPMLGVWAALAALWVIVSMAMLAAWELQEWLS